MSAVWSAVALATDPSPSPSPTSQLTELEVTPGLAGFVATFAVAAACVLLFLSLTRHLRRAQHNAEERGIPVEQPKRVGFSRPGEGDPTGGAGRTDGPADRQSDESPGGGQDEDGQERR